MFNRSEMNVPTMDLELKIAPVIRQMVYKMVLSEDEARLAIESAVNEAVVRFDWRETIRKEVESTLQHEVRKILENIGRRLLWDEEIFSMVKARTIKALSEKEQP